MRIERIEIDGFGRFHDASWTFEDGLTVLHGANEAGKTTLLNAIRALLFGFESTRDGRTWYPPLAGGRRGGRLLLQLRSGERWTVERHGDRGGSGALAVRAPNGNQGGQETLDRLLHGADRDLFNNIFAFGLGELQTFASLSADGVRGRIYGAGAGLGGTSAVDIERLLRRQLDDIFLPRGRERPLNQLLARIEQLRGEVADLSRQPQEHADAHRELDAMYGRAAELREAMRRERERAARISQLLDARAPAVELAMADAELDAGDATLDRLAPDALAVLERHDAALDEARTALDELRRELAEAREERSRIQVDRAVLGVDELILAIRDESVVRTAVAARRLELETAAARHALAVEEQTRAAGMEEARLIALDDSIAAVEQTRDLERHLVEARGAAIEVERRHAAAREELELRERESEMADAADPDLSDRLSALEELDRLRMRRAVAEARARGAVPAWVAPVAGVAGLLVGALAGVAMAQIAIGLLGGLLLGAAMAIVVRRLRHGGSESIAALAVERRALLERAGLGADADDDAARALAAELTTRQARAAVAADHRAGLEARRREVERREGEAAAARRRFETATEAWHAWLVAAGLPGTLTPEATRQLLTAAGIARRSVAERDEHRRQLDRIDEEARAFDARVDELAASLGEAMPADPARRAAFVAGAVDRLEAARDASRRAAALEASLERLAARHDAAASALAEREAALATYLAHAGCPDADALRERDRAAASRRATASRARELRAHLAGVAGDPGAVDALVAEARSVDPAELEAARAEALGQLERLEGEEREVLNRIGALDARIRQLEAADELGMRRQELAVLEGQAAALARAWAVRSLALRLLEETRSRYERERQPDVVRAAAGHFERITDGCYARIVAPPGDAAVRVETEGGEQRSPDELSRGTAEQLYLALRFGLIEEFGRNAEPLPVVMDDILVNFDAVRAERAASSIRDLASRHQVLYFTCHRPAAELLDPDGGRTIALG